jgi:hypothetical protein
MRKFSANFKFRLYKTLIRSIMTYVCFTWEHEADAHLLRLQRLQNRAHRVIGDFDRCTPVRELQVAFKIPYVYDYATQLSRTQAEVILNHENPNVSGTGQETPGI